MAEIIVEEVKCGLLMLSEWESDIHFYLFRNEADSFSSMLQLTNLKFTFITINVPLFKKLRDIIFLGGTI
jgi:hypothetical protein